ncbi:hypothetical protein EPUS_02844 [Endocarpon pusillum Z07020]|uniref:Beta-catenin-like protein 1 N-terminal domain-containing protein n=1 Tax=Endocarpon pusillum (strain Z07020 / HMAS-L-300199) TaxID=1263415 RepID=U1G5F0_ENDPU|nr:uncharacterized protein EPUS_02844 [Endocarpon pusillum Z07020]ERF72562.1 hypothetical protein EPUS_02844 [Endocarpon pusillum Z07020]
MASIDDLFRKSTTTTSSSISITNKRKFPDHTLSPTYKSAKISANGTPHTSTIEDGDDAHIEAGPSLPPTETDNAAEEEDDEEGRFFGSGVSADTRQALDYVEGAMDGELGAGEEEVIDAAWLRRMAVGFEKRITRNAELRARFEAEPEKFMTSEADLDADIKGLSILSEHSELYAEFAKLGCVGSLVALLAHENTDIAIDAIEVLGELTDEDVEADETQWRALVDAMLDAGVVELLTQNLGRLDEDIESDRAGVYHILAVVENLSSQESIVEDIAVGNDGLLRWLLGRIGQKEKRVGQNMRYAAEVLAILLQSSPKTRRRFAEMDGLDALLQILSAYRKKDPEKDSDEEEYVENLFDCLVCLVDESTGKGKFTEAEGVELCLIMLREGKMSKSRALRVLDHAMGGSAGGGVCEGFVEASGLKTIFGMFMKKQEREAIEHLLGIFSSLLRLLPGQSASRVRTLAKFMEKDFEKIQKLVDLRQGYTARMTVVGKAIRMEGEQLNPEERAAMADEWLSRRLDAGLFSLQTVDVILSWLIAEDDGARSRVEKLLKGRDESFENLKQSLREQLDGIDAEQSSEQAEAKDMLGTLLQCL